jgi:hypothetical protein
MSRKLLCLLALIISASHAEAIELRSVTVRAGAAHVSSDLQFEGAELITVDSIIEPSASVSLRWRNSYRSRFDILTELAYLRGGYDRDGLEVRATFVQLPLLLRSDLGGEDASIYLVFGPSISLLVNGEDELISRYRDFSLAGQAGLGMYRKVNPQFAIYAEFRFSGDLTNLYSPAGDNDSLESVRQRVLQLSAGIEF